MLSLQPSKMTVYSYSMEAMRITISGRPQSSLLVEYLLPSARVVRNEPDDLLCGHIEIHSVHDAVLVGFYDHESTIIVHVLQSATRLVDVPTPTLGCSYTNPANFL
jgi:hypothetical protein